MNRPTLRRMMIFEAAVRLGSIGASAAEIGLSQPAATHALAKLEDEVGDILLERDARGSTPTPAGHILYRRAARMLCQIEAALASSSGELPALRRMRTLTDAQLRSHLAIAETGSFRAAAIELRIAEPTLHRAARTLESIVGIALYQRRPHGIGASPAGARLAAQWRLALGEIEQGLDELGAARGAAAGRLSLGCLPLMPKTVMARAVGKLLRVHPNVAISVEENAQEALISLLVSGAIDMVLGALRLQDPTPGTRQTRLFADPYVVVSGLHHPLAQVRDVSSDDLARYPWVIPWRDTPRRIELDALFARLPRRPLVVVETSSVAMMRATLAESECLTLLARSQVSEEAGRNLAMLNWAMGSPGRSVGIVTRSDWLPTAMQEQFLAILRSQNEAEFAQ